MHVVVLAWVLGMVAGEGATPVDWIERSPNGAYQFAYATGDDGGHYRTEVASADNTVAGRYGSRDPSTGGNAETTYTAGRRGFRARGPNIARHMSLSQAGAIRPHDDGLYHPELDLVDPTEDRGYDFRLNTRSFVKEEHADARGDVRGRYSYFDDIGAQHSVEYSAGAGTGFNVHNPVPDSFVQAQASPIFFQGKLPGSKARGYTAIQKNLDGSYKFSASAPDHKRNEISDVLGNRRGSYTYFDDKGVQHTVEYIAGPNIGYQVINNRRPFLFGSTLAPLLPTSGPSLSSLLSNSQSSSGPLLPESGSTPSPFGPSSPSPGSLSSGSPSSTLSSSGTSGLSTSNEWGLSPPTSTLSTWGAFGPDFGSINEDFFAAGLPTTSSNGGADSSSTASGVSSSSTADGSQSGLSSGSGSGVSSSTASGGQSGNFGGPSSSTASGGQSGNFGGPSSSTASGGQSGNNGGLSSSTASGGQSGSYGGQSPSTATGGQSGNYGGLSSSTGVGGLSSTESSSSSSSGGGGFSSSYGGSAPNRTSSSNCCYGTWHTGPKYRLSARDAGNYGAEDALSHSIAIRAHVQSIDVGSSERFMSPSDALYFFGSGSEIKETIVKPSNTSSAS